MRLALLSLPLLLTTASAETLLVGNKMEDTISFVDLETGDEVERLETGRAPHEIAISPDGSYAIVVSYKADGYVGNTLHGFDIAKAEAAGEIDLGEARAPHGARWIPNTDYVAVTAENSQEVVVAWPTGKRVRYSIPTGQEGSHMIAVSPDGVHGYVANMGSGTFSVLNLVSAEKIRDVEAGQGPEGISVSPDGATILVGNNGSKKIMSFDAETYEKTGEARTEGVPIRVEIAPDGKHFAVSLHDLGKVQLFRLSDMTVAGEIELGDGSRPVTLLFSPDGDRLWAAATGLAQIVEIDMESFEERRRFDVGQGSDGLGYSRVSVEKDD
jgi:YVTN family beta-propeller protein